MRALLMVLVVVVVPLCGQTLGQSGLMFYDSPDGEVEMTQPQRQTKVRMHRKFMTGAKVKRQYLRGPKATLVVGENPTFRLAKGAYEPGSLRLTRLATEKKERWFQPEGYGEDKKRMSRSSIRIRAAISP